jgi:hypothetical protein
MGRHRTWIVILAAIALVLVHLVFRVRVMFAGGKLLLSVLVILGVVWVLWPRDRGD